MWEPRLTDPLKCPRRNLEGVVRAATPVLVSPSGVTERGPQEWVAPSATPPRPDARTPGSAEGPRPLACAGERLVFSGLGLRLLGWGVPCAVFCSLRSSESPRFKGTGQAAPLVCRGSQGAGRAVKPPWGHPPLRCCLSVVSPPGESRTSQVEGRPPHEPLRPSQEPPSSGTQENFVLDSQVLGAGFWEAPGKCCPEEFAERGRKERKYDPCLCGQSA